MASIKKPLKGYSLNQSPFYKLKSRRKLASLFNLELKELERLVKRPDNYRVFIIGKGTNKHRVVEVPKIKLERIHRRLFNLLRRIRTPEYLHSGVKGKSYITNAKTHINADRLITLDIQKFFPSTLGWHIFEFFCDEMKCSSDVAGLLTSICTYDNHVPTGSCISQIIAFYAHKSMFDEIDKLTKSLNLNMTCYVDDIAVSGNKANRKTLYLIRGIIKRRALRSPSRKEHIYDIGKPKKVTGSIINKGTMLLPNKKHKLIHKEIEVIRMTNNAEERLYLI